MQRSEAAERALGFADDCEERANHWDDQAADLRKRASVQPDHRVAARMRDSAARCGDLAATCRASAAAQRSSARLL